MYKLYWANNTGAFVAHAALEEAGANYQINEIDYENKEHKGKEYLKINPVGQIPALVLPDGTLITESAAIVLHVADAFPRITLLPEAGSAGRGSAYRWLLYMATNTYDADLRYYYSHRYTTEQTQTDGVKQAGLIHMDESFNLMDSILKRQPYLAGSKISIVDTYLVMMTMWYPEIPDLLKRCVNIQRVVSKVRQRPAIQKIWNKNFPDDSA